MADLTITAANVKGAGALGEMKTQNVVFGETVTNGELVYLKTSDNKYWKTDADSSQAETVIAGVVLVGNSTNGVGTIVTEGPMVIGATMTAGATYYASANKGKIAEAGDVGGDWLSVAGQAISTTVLWVNIKNHPYQMP